MRLAQTGWLGLEHTNSVGFVHYGQLTVKVRPHVLDLLGGVVDLGHRVLRALTQPHKHTAHPLDMRVVVKHEQCEQPQLQRVVFRAPRLPIYYPSVISVDDEQVDFAAHVAVLVEEPTRLAFSRQPHGQFSILLARAGQHEIHDRLVLLHVGRQWLAVLDSVLQCCVHLIAPLGRRRGREWQGFQDVPRLVLTGAGNERLEAGIAPCAAFSHWFSPILECQLRR